MKKIIITTTVVALAIGGLAYQYPERMKDMLSSSTTAVNETVQEVIALPAPQKSPVELAREEAARIAESQKLMLDALNVEEDTILSEKDAVTTAYEAEVAELKAAYQAKVDELEGRIEEINTVRASF